MNAWNSSMNSFDYIVGTLSNSLVRPKITKEQYNEWKKQYVFDALRDYRLGQSFCEYFGISNASPLYHFKSNSFCEQWIFDNYIQDEKEVC